MSRAALSTRRPEPLGDDGGDLVLRQVARALASPLDQGPLLVVGEVGLEEMFMDRYTMYITRSREGGG